MLLCNYGAKSNPSPKYIPLIFGVQNTHGGVGVLEMQKFSEGK
jgi:hypothetical protein